MWCSLFLSLSLTEEVSGWPACDSAARSWGREPAEARRKAGRPCARAARIWALSFESSMTGRCCSGSEEDLLVCV